MKIRLRLIPLAIALAVSVLGYGSAFPDDSSSGASALSQRFLVRPENLPAMLKHSDTILLAAQSTLEIVPAGFVNNAISVDVDELTTFSETPDAFTNFAGWEERFGALGISTKSTVVVYDDGEMKFASRVRFLLAYFGVRRALLLNGGFNALQPLIAGGILFVTAPGTATPATFSVHVQDRPIHLVDQQFVASVLGDPSVTFLDVRIPTEFAGCTLLPGIKRGGHIPGARNLPLINFFTPQISNPDLFFLNAPGELASTFDTFGLHRHDHIVVYCHDGAQSSLAAMALIDAGYTDVSLYYLSYLDWQANDANPVELIEPCN